MFKLTIEDDEGKTTVVPVIRDEMTIGRDEGNTIRLTERNVSRRHARLMRQSGSIFVEDLKSFTGVRVNGTKISAPTAVSEGDQLQIGDYKIKVKSDRPTEVTDRPTRPAMAAINGNDGAAAVYAPTPPIRTTSGAPAPAGQPSTSVTSMGRAVTPRPVPTHSVPDLLPVPDPLEAQPTIPLRMLSDVDPSLGPGQTGSVPVSPARLVVLTTELAGKEFALDRASLVIGRTNENDVVLNHRSISRHHAKIVQDRDHFTIVDLQSANGVRVNGEDYERIELHPGDVVELGHVRIRFVGPLENYVFDPLSRSLGGRSKMAYALVGLFLAAAAALVLQRTLGTRGDDGSAAIAARAPGPPVPAAPSATPAPAGAAATAPSVPAAPAPAISGADELLALAASQAKSESWDAGLATLDRLAALAVATAPSDAAGTVKKQAAELRQRLETERRNAIVYAKFDESAQQKNYPSAVDWYSELPEESVYKARARPRFDQAKTALVGQYLAAAEKLRQVGKCSDLRQEVELIDRIDPHNVVAQDKLRLCRPRSEGAVVAATARSAAPRQSASALASRSEGSSSRRSAAAASAEGAARRSAGGDAAAAPAKRSTDAATTPAAESEGGDADTLMKQARDAWLRQQCGSAIDLSRKAIRARPGMVDAYQVIAVCSCSLKDAEGATRAYAKLDDKSRSLVRTLCQRNGIAVSE